MAADTKALICTGVGKVEIQSVPKPKLEPGYVLVKTKAVALNPSDWKNIDEPSGSNVGTRPGIDFAGVVEEVGPNVTKDYKPGDRVCGSVWGTKNAESGAYGDYVVALEHLTLKIPDHLSFEEVSTIGVGLTTCGQALYQLLGLPLPPSPAAEPSQAILIGGGSTATAVLGIQYAKLSGLRVIATASPHNFEYLQSLGADVVLDYHESTESLVEKIKKATDDSLTMTWDCSPNDTFHRVAALSMSRTQNGTYVTVMPLTSADYLKGVNPMVETKSQFSYTAFGETFTYFGNTFPASPEDVSFARSFWERTATLLAENKLRPIRATVNNGGQGLEGVVCGLEELKQGKVSGTKLVYTL